MKQTSTLLTLLVSFMLLQGCAGGLIVVAGTAVAVSSDERSVSEQLADDNLSLAALDKISELNLNHQKININLITNAGYLLIVGQVSSEAEKEMIEAKLNELTGIKEVYNQLRINKPITFSQQTKDSWITAKAKGQLTTHKDINSLQIKVVTEDSEIFLIGLVNSKAADAATNIASKIDGVKHVHRVFQLLPEKSEK